MPENTEKTKNTEQKEKRSDRGYRELCSTLKRIQQDYPEFYRGVKQQIYAFEKAVGWATKAR